MNEAETRAELIDPALKAAGWGVVEGSRVRREAITKGRLEGRGRRARGEAADYVLTYRSQKLAVIEAKRRDLPVTEGLGQAKGYAEKLQARFAFATNGVGIWRVDMATGAEGPVDAYPSPDELWAAAFADVNDWRVRFGEVPYETNGGQFEPRYYQHNAVNNVLEAIANGRDRILLTLATGTGKTAIAFQIAWKLFQSRWNLSREPTRRPRILFLADRNILANQAYLAFSAFPPDALLRIAPDEVRRMNDRTLRRDGAAPMAHAAPAKLREGTRRVPKNAAVFFTIFQTFMTGRDAKGEPVPYFGDYPPDFFDLVIVDECHRGGANDESNWRGILEHFAPAVQLGLTATPKRTINADTYRYFGEPVYTYSLKDGINDGFLTPFRVKQIATTLDDYVYTPDDDVVEGEIEEGRRYEEKDFNRIIEIRQREEKRVRTFMDMIDQREKTLVFCATQAHAAAVRDLINQMKTSTDPNYCVRVTANDGARGEQDLAKFQDNEKTIPTILTTSQKLSTGVDARNVRNIVLMRPINSMIEFKQIIGRGTRLYEGKDFFTIYDFVKAYLHFNDPEWDGEPIEPEPPKPRPPAGDGDVGGDDDTRGDDGDDSDIKRPAKVVVKLADGKARQIQHMSVTTFWSPDGKPMSAAQFLERLYGELPALFKDEDELRALWGDPTTRRRLLQGLAERGFADEQLDEMRRIIGAEDSDIFDVLAYVAFSLDPVRRVDRAEATRGAIQGAYDGKLAAFLDFVLGHYVADGEGELDDAKLPDLLRLRYRGDLDASRELGGLAAVRSAFVGFQRHLYRSGNPPSERFGGTSGGTRPEALAGS